MKRAATIIAMATTLGAVPCFADGINLALTRADFGEEWPFTVPRGVLNCRVVGQLSSGEPIKAVTFAANGKVYAVNGIARGGHAKKNGWHDLKEIWRSDPKAPGLKVSTGVVIDRGLLLCEASS